MLVLPEAQRSPVTLGVTGACCLRCPDEPCMRFSTVESGGGNTIQVCPVDAIHDARQHAGPVISDSCVRCGLCVVRCPVGALALSHTGGVTVTPPNAGLTAPAGDESVFIENLAAQRANVDWEDGEWAALAMRLSEAAVGLRQDAFYPLVAHLFTAAGHPAWRPARGDTNNRVDLILVDDEDSLPVEVKSRVESAVINVKSVQQALENHVVMDQRDFAATNSDSSTLVVGYEYPPARSDVTELIEDIATAFGVNVGLISLVDLYNLALRVQLAGDSGSRTVLRELRGRLS